MVKIQVRDIIDLFDVRKNDLKHHISSIIGLVGEDLGAALFKKYYEEAYGKEVVISSNSPLGVTKNKKGHRLDRWIYIPGTKIAYQTEIKNWSCYAIGAREICQDADVKNIAGVGLQSWQDRIRVIQSKEINGENKVLCTMKTPNDFPTDSKIEPLLIQWMVLSDDGKTLKPFFRYTIHKNGFENVSIFSMSNYLRSLKPDRVLELYMPNVEKRTGLLMKHFQVL